MCHVNARVAEADDVGALVPGDVGERPRMALDPPPAGEAHIAEVRDRPRDWPVRAGCLRQRDVDARVTEANDVRPAVTGGVGEETRMLVDLPALISAEIRDDEFHWSERSVGLRDRAVDARVTEANDVRPAVTGGVGEETRMLVDLPALISAEIRDDEFHWSERSVGLRDRAVDPRITEANDVRPAVTGGVGEETRMGGELPGLSREELGGG